MTPSEIIADAERECGTTDHEKVKHFLAGELSRLREDIRKAASAGFNRWPPMEVSTRQFKGTDLTKVPEAT